METTNQTLHLDDGTLVYQYIRGSQAYGLNTKDSDIDHGGIYICSPQVLYGLPSNYKPLIESDKGDDVYYEIGKWAQLLFSSNPTILESLFMPPKTILYEDDIITLFKKHKEEFLTQACFNSFFGFAKSQITKARGLKKKIVNPCETRLTPLDFCYTFHKQGSIKIENFLTSHGLKEKYCGLVNIPNMYETYGLYYDFQQHIDHEGVNLSNPSEKDKVFVNFIQTMDYNPINPNKLPIGYKGILNDNHTSNELRLSSIPKLEKVLCYITYNRSAYSQHCRSYKEYQEWVKNRNPSRYESNLNQNYDGKNMMHCFRILHMAKEIAQGKGLIIERTEDKDFLLAIRNHQLEWNELAQILETEVEEFEILKAKTTLEESIDTELVNTLLVHARENFYTH